MHTKSNNNEQELKYCKSWGGGDVIVTGALFWRCPPPLIGRFCDIFFLCNNTRSTIETGLLLVQGYAVEMKVYLLIFCLDFCDDYNPCLNGTCGLQEGKPFVCDCFPGFAGKFCERGIPNYTDRNVIFHIRLLRLLNKIKR